MSLKIFLLNFIVIYFHQKCTLLAYNAHAMKKKLRSRLRKLALSLLPDWCSHRIIRGTLNIKYESPAHLNFKVAEDADEFCQAMRLIYKNYLEEGYTEPSASMARLTPYHLSPKTAVIVVKHELKVIATMSVVLRTDLGLPLESIYDLNSVFQATPLTGEISALAVDRQYRGNHGELLYHLMKYMYHFNVEILGLQTEVIGVNPKMSPLYRAIMLFDRLPNARVQKYSFANNAVVVPLCFDLTRDKEIFQRAYKNCEPTKNMMQFFLSPKPSNYLYPKSESWQHQLAQNKKSELSQVLFEIHDWQEQMDRLSISKLKTINSAFFQCTKDESLGSNYI